MGKHYVKLTYLLFFVFQNANPADPEGEAELPLGFCPDPRASICSISSSHLSGYYHIRQRAPPQGAHKEVAVGMEAKEDEEEEEGPGEKEDQDPPVPLPPLLSLGPLLTNSQELDSGVGRTDDSTRCEESPDLLGDQTSAPNTSTTNTPGSTRKFRAGPSPR